MENSEATYQLIEAYLAGTMPDDEKARFNERLESDAGLRQELSLQFELQEYLLDEKEQAFKHTLLKIRAEQKGPSNKKSSWWLLIPILLSFLAIFLLNRDAIPISDESINEEVIQPEEKNEATEIIQLIEEENKENKPIKETLKSKPSQKQNEVKNETIKEDQNEPLEKGQLQMAMLDFSTNETLEQLMSSNSRGVDEEIEIIYKTKDQQFINNKPSQIKLILNLETKSILREQDLVLYLFSNKDEAYSAFQPLLTLNTKLTKSQNGYSIEIDKNIMLNPGLYYYLLEKGEEEDLLFIDKFLIKH